MALNHNKKFSPLVQSPSPAQHSRAKEREKNQKISRHYLDQAYRIEGDKEHKKKS